MFVPCMWSMAIITLFFGINDADHTSLRPKDPLQEVKSYSRGGWLAYFSFLSLFSFFFSISLPPSIYYFFRLAVRVEVNL